MSVKERFIYRPRPAAGGEEGPPAEFIFFIGDEIDDEKSGDEAEVEQPAPPSADTRNEEASADVESRLAQELARLDEDAAISGAASPKAQREESARPLEPAASNVLPGWSDGFDWGHEPFPTTFKPVIEHQPIEARSRVRIVIAAVAAIGILGLAASFFLSGPSTPDNAAVDAESGAAKPQADGASRAVEGGHPLSSAESPLQRSSSVAEDSQRPADGRQEQHDAPPAVSEHNDGDLTTGAVGGSPASATQETDKPASADGPVQSGESRNASAEPGEPRQDEAVSPSSPPPSRPAAALSPPPSQLRAEQRRDNVERPHPDADQIRRRQLEAQRNKELAAIRSRLLRERMNEWWAEANKDWRINEAPAVTEARKARAREAETRVDSEIAALPASELRKIEARWKSQELARRQREKLRPKPPAGAPSTGPGN